MAHNQSGGRPPVKAASAIAQYVPVAFLPAASALGETVIRAGSFNEIPFGVTLSSVASPGDPVTIGVRGETVKGVAGASLGAGALVAVGSVNGILVPIVPSGLSTALGSALGALGVRWAVGIAMKNAAAADLFPVYLDPSQII